MENRERALDHIRRDMNPLEAALELERRGVPFVLATVVRAVAPTSAKPGDKAIVTEEGVCVGWIGGSCAEPIVRDETCAALKDGQHRLVHISPKSQLPSDRQGLTLHPMTCYSGGALEIHLEPRVPAPRLVVFGASPVAHALCRLGGAMGYRTTRVEPVARPDAHGLEDVDGDGAGPLWVVVATHGTFDTDALTKALAWQTDYLGLVVSQKRARQVRARLEAKGFTTEALARLHAPAGLWIGAKSPEEVAVSILSEVVAHRHGHRLVRATAPSEIQADEASDSPHDAPEIRTTAPSSRGGCGS
ncbi:MAG: XdhC family protein [Myxococcota bacterium]